MKQSLVVTISASAASTNSWINLEQEFTPATQNNASLASVIEMVTRAFTGLSARTYQPDLCPSAKINTDGTLVATIHVFVWPSSLALAYGLQPAGAEIGARELVRVEREVDVAFEGSATVTLPWLMEDGATGSWELGCYDSKSVEIDPPAVTISGATVNLDGECYGVLRVKGVATGYKYPAACTFTKAIKNEESGEYLWQNVGDLDLSIKATWSEDGESREEILKLELPDCVGDLLELCPNDVPNIFWGTRWENYGKTFKIHYNACTGDVMWMGYEDDDEK